MPKVHDDGRRFNRRSFLAAASMVPFVPAGGATREWLTAQLAAMPPIPQYPNPIPGARYIIGCIRVWTSGKYASGEWWVEVGDVPTSPWELPQLMGWDEFDSHFIGQCEFADRLSLLEAIYSNNQSIIDEVERVERDGGPIDLADAAGWFIPFEIEAMIGSLSWIVRERGYDEGEGDDDDPDDDDDRDAAARRMRRPMDLGNLKAKVGGEFATRIVTPTAGERAAVEGA